MRNRLLPIALLCLATWAMQAHATEWYELSTDAQFLAGLRQRQLFRLAETFCVRQLQQDMPDTNRAELTIELIRTYAQHAIYSAPTDRAPYWKSARDSASRFLSEHPENPRRLLVQVQESLTLLARGELARQEAKIGRNRDEALATALVTVREAIRMLERLERAIAAEIPQRTTNTQADGVLTADELIALRNNVRYQIARGFRNRALCYPIGSQDRIAALASATEMLDRILTELGENDSLTWQVRIDRIVCERLLGDTLQALQRIRALKASGESVDTASRLRAEEIRCLVALQQYGELPRALQTQNTATPSSAELDFARLEGYLALWKAASDAQDEAAAKNWRDAGAVAMVERMEQQYGAYWSRRANQLLVNRLGSAPASGNLQIMTRTADNLYLKNQLDEAITAYEDAAANALSNNDLESAFTLLSKTVLIEKKRGDTKAMIAKLRRLAMQLSPHPLASGRHLSAIKLCIPLARTDAEQLKLYEDLLQEHIATWPTQPTADTVRIWLGRIWMARQNWRRAIEMYTTVDPSSVELHQAIKLADLCYGKLFKRLQSDEQPIAEEAAKALQFFESIILTNNRLPTRWSKAQRTAALSVAKLHLNYNSAGAARCETILRAAIGGLPPASEDWLAQAQAWLVVALATQPTKQAEAQIELQKVGGTRPQELYKMLMALSDLSSAAAPAMQKSLANLRLSGTDALDGSKELQPEQQQAVLFERADALEILGRTPEAIQLLRQLAQRSPRDGRIQERYGDALIESKDRPTLEQALTQWRLVSQKSSPKSERWFKAKYHIALALFRLGDRKRAADVLGVLQLTTDLNATKWGDDIRALLKLCQS